MSGPKQSEMKAGPLAEPEAPILFSENPAGQVRLTADGWAEAAQLVEELARDEPRDLSDTEDDEVVRLRCVLALAAAGCEARAEFERGNGE